MSNALLDLCRLNMMEDNARKRGVEDGEMAALVWKKRPLARKIVSETEPVKEK